MMIKPILSKQAFWDVDMDKIDYEKNARYVIEKVVRHGSSDDFIVMRKFYGDEKICREIVYTKKSARYRY